ncbi:hypothetical protein FPANT_2987 [Fusarium pseudoanthophilum]|uniref:Uncharacterized protein n=1 Tax=Fusarium pseudoanthophilum TaxID=48495 RepID=A0A8H5UUN7_9HYPO|nr:hypothetical protein FPANT_2987 [Fusarium pseudoanthophilum]
MPPNQREVQRQLMASYNIFFDVPIESEGNPQWPSSFNQIFQAVRDLGKREYAEYSETITANITQAPWKAQAQLRAECVRKKVKQCLDTRKNESGWRSSLENRIMARFDTEIACRNCRNRLWRSELEVTATSQSGADDRGADDRSSLRARQGRRQPCQCNAGGGGLALLDNGISPIFDDRAEQGMVCSPALQVELQKREVRPDRVYGLQATKRFGRLLELTQGVRSNPFKPDGEPLIFPFLVIEAKSEKAGSSNSDIQLQTGFAIRELLMIQYELGEAAGEDGNWHGGPLVWFVSYRGEDWRVSAAYIHKMDDEISYRVVRLWKGSLDSLDDTLQLLLIMDYIADWARDIYREGIASSLQKLAVSDSASLAHDEDIYSRSGGLRSRASSLFTASRPASRFGGSRAPSHFDYDPVPSQPDVSDAATKQAAVEDHPRKFDHESGVFRDVRFVQSKFTGLIINHENVEEFLNTSTTIGETKSLLSVLLTHLDDVCLISGYLLGNLERLWTDTERKLPDMLCPDELFYTIIMVTFYLTPDWEPTRELSCLAVSKKLVQDSMRYSRLSIAQIGEFAASPVVQSLSGFKELLAWKFVRNLYCLYKIGRNEPNISFLRVSSAMDQLSTTEELRQRCGPVDKTYWPWKDDPKLRKLSDSIKNMLVARKEPQDTYYKSSLCIFINASKCASGMLAGNIFQSPDTHLLIRRLDEDPGETHGLWAMESFGESDHDWSVDLGIQISNDTQLLIENLDIYSQHLKELLRMPSIRSWDELIPWLVMENTAQPLEISSTRAFKRQLLNGSKKSVLLDLGWHEAWTEAQSRRREKVNNHKENTFRRPTVDRLGSIGESMQVPTSEVGFGPRYSNQDDNDQMDHVVMSERMRGKRPIRTMDTLDVAESSAHAERRARQQREATQRANNRLSLDYELPGMWAD